MNSRRATVIGIVALLAGGSGCILVLLERYAAAHLFTIGALIVCGLWLVLQARGVRVGANLNAAHLHTNIVKDLCSTEALESSSVLREHLERALSRVWAAAQDISGIELEIVGYEPIGVTSSIAFGGSVRAAQEREVYRSDLRFAGELLGRLSARPEGGSSVEQGDAWLLHELATECTMLLLNARYTQAILPHRRESHEQIRVRSTFLANLSHELRSPIAIALNASELLLERVCGELTPDQEETLSMVKLHAEHLMELISDVLDYARVEAGTLTPEPELLLLSEQVAEVVRMVRSQAERKQQAIRYRPASEEFPVRFDRRQLRQALLNILSNACKYTPQGGTIEVWVESVTNENLRVCVRDSGIGIAEQDRARVFMPFERLDHPYARTQVGTGLGLSLTSKLVALNSATIDFHSELGCGSTFWIEIPRDHSSITPAPTPLTERAPHSAGERVLFVAPEDEERIIVARYLRSLGYEILFASSESEARQCLRTNKVSMVLLTDRFTPPDGRQLASFVRDEQRDRHIAVLLMTRRAFLTDVERYLREEVDRCLPKPVRLVELARACRETLDLTNNCTLRR